MPATTLTPAQAAALVAQVEDAVRALAVKWGRTKKHDYEDLAQIAREAAWVATETFEPGIATFSTYADRAMTMALRNAVRAGGRKYVAPASLNAPVGFQGEEGGEWIDTIAGEVVAAADEIVSAGEREEQVRRIVAAVKAEHFAAKPALFDALVERLMAAEAVRADAQTNRSEVTLADVAAAHGCSREWVRRTEMSVRARLSVALASVVA
jgi:RNA polymerase sigma factor (sigma-70 family)